MSKLDKKAEATPGPWRINDMALTYVIKTDKRIIARTEFGGEVDYLNALLVSAAPEMLKVLQDLNRAYLQFIAENPGPRKDGALHQVLRDCNIIIAKATGEEL